MRIVNRKLKARIIEIFGTQSDFAFDAKVDETLVSKVVCGGRTLSSEKKAEWCKLLELENQDIFDT